MKRLGLWTALLAIVAAVLAVELTGAGLVDASPAETVAGATAADAATADATASVAPALPVVVQQPTCDPGGSEFCPPTDLTCNYEVPLILTEVEVGIFGVAPNNIDLGATCDPRLDAIPTFVSGSTMIGGVNYPLGGTFTQAQVDAFVADNASTVRTLTLLSADGSLTVVLNLTGPVVVRS